MRANVEPAMTGLTCEWGETLKYASQATFMCEYAVGRNLDLAGEKSKKSRLKGRNAEKLRRRDFLQTIDFVEFYGLKLKGERYLIYAICRISFNFEILSLNSELALVQQLHFGDFLGRMNIEKRISYIVQLGSQKPNSRYDGPHMAAILSDFAAMR